MTEQNQKVPEFIMKEIHFDQANSGKAKDLIIAIIEENTPYGNKDISDYVGITELNSNDHYAIKHCVSLGLEYWIKFQVFTEKNPGFQGDHDNPADPDTILAQYVSIHEISIFDNDGNPIKYNSADIIKGVEDYFIYPKLNKQS